MRVMVIVKASKDSEAGCARGTRDRGDNAVQYGISGIDYALRVGHGMVEGRIRRPHATSAGLSGATWKRPCFNWRTCGSPRRQHRVSNRGGKNRQGNQHASRIIASTSCSICDARSLTPFSPVAFMRSVGFTVAIVSVGPF